MSTGRLEAFSDGVIAVAITLLVLNLPSPDVPVPHLAAYLGSSHHWPAFVAYAVSFVTIGIVWVNHHSMISRLRQGDHVILVINLFLLLTIVLLPFTTRVMATYLTQSSGQHLAAALYSGSFLLMSLVFSALNWNIWIRRPHLLADDLDRAARHRVFGRAVIGVVPYVVATALAPVSPYVTLGLCGAIAGYYALPVASGR